MHYVLKSKIGSNLIASARDVKNEFLRLQSRILSIDQNNIGLGSDALMPEVSGTVETGITFESFFPTSSDSSPGLAKSNSQSLTRFHRQGFSAAMGGIAIEQGEHWTDQEGVFMASHTFQVYRPGPYLFVGSLTLSAECEYLLIGSPQGFEDEPLRALMSVRLDGDILEPVSSQSYGNAFKYVAGSTADERTIFMPMFFVTTRILQPGTHTSFLTVKRICGEEAEVLYPQLLVLGLIR